MAGPSQINRALNLIPKRAEDRQAARLRDTFVDNGVAAALEAIDSQVLYGRRGTGKTHALRYLETVVEGRGDLAVYVDLRTVGSPEGLFLGETIPITERASRLLVDLLSNVHDSLLQAAFEDEELIEDASFVSALDALADSLSTVKVSGDVERSVEEEARQERSEGFDAKVGLPNPTLELSAGTDFTEEGREKRTEVHRGTERISLNFGAIARALRALADAAASRRVWILLDEWSSVPPDVQPYLGEFLVRCVLPLQPFTVKIAAIEQQSRFRVEVGGVSTIGIELGADVAANVDLDEFMVFEQNEERAREFFSGLLFKHLTLGVDENEKVEGLNREGDLVRMAFTDRRAFDEFVRAAEGVPRDAINIAARAALSAGGDQISVPGIRDAARGWFQTDKAAALQSRERAVPLLNWVIDNVIKEKRARGFLVNQKSAGAPLLMTLFDARVLHLIRRGYSGQEEPGERYDVYVIDYGAYVDLIQTKYAPQGTLPFDDESGSSAGYTEVPTLDLRAIRRAVLDLDEFLQSEAGGGASTRPEVSVEPCPRRRRPEGVMTAGIWTSATGSRAGSLPGHCGV